MDHSRWSAQPQLGRRLVPVFPHHRGHMALAREAAEIGDFSDRDVTVGEAFLGKGEAPVEYVWVAAAAIEPRPRGKSSDGGRRFPG